MRGIYAKRLAVYILVAFAMVLVGCASSPPSRFYQLSPVSAQTEVGPDVSRQGSVIVAIGPLRMPDYLDRPQIATRSGQNELKFSEFDRWAGSIENNMALILAEDVSAKLPRDRFFVMQWTPMLEKQLLTSYRVALHVIRFDGTLGGSVNLLVQWSIFGKDNQLLLKEESNITEQVNGGGYDALVAAMSRSIAKLSQGIADGIAFLSK